MPIEVEVAKELVHDNYSKRMAGVNRALEENLKNKDWNYSEKVRYIFKDVRRKLKSEMEQLSISTDLRKESKTPVKLNKRVTEIQEESKLSPFSPLIAML
jgi:hypothetical protein